MEATILLALQSLRLPVLTQLAALVSAFGNYAFIWVVIGILLIVFAHRNDVGITVIFTVILAGIIVGFILQPMFAHVRPYDAGIGVSAVMGVSRTGYSFPSFHAATSFAAATVIAMIAGRRWGSCAFVGAVLISLSRVYLGVEWPIDIVVGVVSAWVYNQFLHDLIRDYPGVNRARSGRRSVSSASAPRRGR